MAATADDGGPAAGEEEGEAHQRAGATADGKRGRSPGCRPSMAAAAGGGGPPAGEEEGEAHQRVGAATDGERVEAVRDLEWRGQGLGFMLSL